MKSNEKRNSFEIEIKLGQKMYQRGFEDAIEINNTEIEKLIKIKNDAYSERNKCIAALANFLRSTAQPNYRVYVAYHEDEDWENDWRTILVIEKGSVQMTWHFHDSEKHLLEKLPIVNLYKWNGHDTKEKYKRLINLFC